MTTTATAQVFNLTHNAVLIFTGTENECYMKLQRSQSQSADWAIKYEGWKVEPVIKLRSNNKKVVEAVQAYIIDSLDFTSYEQETTLLNAVNTFKSESGPHNGKSYQQHFIDFMQGLPSWFNVDFTYFDIINRLNSWGLYQDEKKDAIDSSNLYWYLLYREFNNLLKKEGLSIY